MHGNFFPSVNNAMWIEATLVLRNCLCSIVYYKRRNSNFKNHKCFVLLKFYRACTLCYQDYVGLLKFSAMLISLLRHFLVTFYYYLYVDVLPLVFWLSARARSILALPDWCSLFCLLNWALLFHLVNFCIFKNKK